MRKAVDWCERSAFFELSAGPDLNKAYSNLYQIYLSMPNEKFREGLLERYPYDVAPVGDDRPFFFRFSYWWHAWPTVKVAAPFMEYSILILLLTIVLAVLLCIFLPLRFLTRKDRRISGYRYYIYYFSSLGLGYLAVEIALLQKFGLFLGHPNFSLSVVLAVLLFSSGIGSLFSQSILSFLGGVRSAALLLAALIAFERFLVFPLLSDLIVWSWLLKVLLVTLLIAPLGLVLGVFLPTGLDQLKRSAADFTPWAWGINGIFSVLAPLLSVAFSLTWGINALFLAAIPIYLAAGFSLSKSIEKAA